MQVLFLRRWSLFLWVLRYTWLEKQLVTLSVLLLMRTESLSSTQRDVNVCSECLAEAKLKIQGISIYHFRAIASCRPNDKFFF